MKRITRKSASSCRSKANENKNSNEVLPSRVLRSTKRKLIEAGLIDEVANEKKRICISEQLGDSSDCVIVEEIVSAKVQKQRDNVLTSTPLPNSNVRNAKFDESLNKSIENVDNDNKTNDVIVISDSSRSMLNTIVVNDSEKSDSDIEIIPSTSGLTNNEKGNGGKPVVENVTNKTCKSIECLLSKPNNLFKTKRQNRNKGRKKRKKSRRVGLKNKNASANGGPIGRPNGGPSDAQPLFGKNIFVGSSTLISKTGLRPIIIDGSNVAFHHSNNKFFSCKGLEICIKYFKTRGHEVVAFVPHYRVKNAKSDNPGLLNKLVKQGDVVLTPSRVIDGQPVVPYDDRFIVQAAAVKGGIIVTRDNYRDLLKENQAWAETIKYRLLQFTWVKDILMFPNDPLGARGPTLEEFLKFG